MYRMIRSTKHSSRRRNPSDGGSARAGFTLIELLVVTGILVVISGALLASNAAFGGVITLRNFAYDVALSVREAQTYGISVRRFGADEFEAGYGVHFRRGSPTSYILFADVNENGSYDGGEEQVESFSIGRNFQISDLCVTLPGAQGETCDVQVLEITFERPEPDAQIRYDGGSSVNRRARIELISPRGDTASVLVEATGQVSVQ